MDKHGSERELSLEERIASCPIHQWGDVDWFLDRASVPTHLHEPFHELILARGRYPRNLSSEEGKRFGREAVGITETYEVHPIEARPLLILFAQIVEQWVAEGGHRN